MCYIQLGTDQQVQGVDHCFHACKKGWAQEKLGVGHLIFVLVVHQNVSLKNMEVKLGNYL